MGAHKKRYVNGARQDVVMGALAWGPLTMRELVGVTGYVASNCRQYLAGLLRRNYVAECADGANYRLTTSGATYVAWRLPRTLADEPAMRH